MNSPIFVRRKPLTSMKLKTSIGGGSRRLYAAKVVELKKGLRRAHRPDVYLEPKWLRYLLTLNLGMPQVPTHLASGGALMAASCRG